MSHGILTISCLCLSHKLSTVNTYYASESFFICSILYCIIAASCSLGYISFCIHTCQERMRYFNSVGGSSIFVFGGLTVEDFLFGGLKGIFLFVTSLSYHSG